MRTDFSEWIAKFREEIAAHQMATFGKLVSLMETEMERQDERIQKFAGMDIEEVARIQTEEVETWYKKMVEEHGPDFIKFDEDDDEDEEWAYRNNNEEVIND